MGQLLYYYRNKSLFILALQIYSLFPTYTSFLLFFSLCDILYITSPFLSQNSAVCRNNINKKHVILLLELEIANIFAPS